MRNLSKQQLFWAVCVAVSLTVLVGLRPEIACAATTPYIVKLAGYQSQPAVTANDVVFQSAPTSDGENDLLSVKLTGALPAVTVAAGPGHQQSPSGTGSVVAYVDRTNPPSGDPADISYSLRLVDLVGGSTATIASGATVIEQPSLSGEHLVWTQGPPGSKDIYHCRIDEGGDGVADFLQTPGWTAAPVVLCGGAGDQSAASAGSRGVAWADEAGGTGKARVLFREWAPASPDVILSADTGFQKPGPATAGALVVWKQKVDDTAVSHIAIHSLDTAVTEHVGSAAAAVNSGAVTDGTRVAWQSQVGTSRVQVWTRDASGTASPAAPFESSQTSPRLVADGILWLDDRHDGGDIALLTASSLDETALTFLAPSTCDYGSAKVTGFLKNGGGEALAGLPVTIEYSYDNFAHVAGSKTVNTVTGGAYSWTFAPTKKTYYRAQFKGDTTRAASSRIVRTVLPRVYLTRPSAKSTQSLGKSYTFSGYLKPRHTAGSKQVRIKAYRYSGGKYRYQKTYYAKAYDYGSYTKYSVKIKLPRTGKWRLKAYHPEDSLNAATYSSYRYVRVR